MSGQNGEVSGEQPVAGRHVRPRSARHVRRRRRNSTRTQRHAKSVSRRRLPPLLVCARSPRDENS